MAIPEKIKMLSSDISHMPLHLVWKHSGVAEKHGFELTVDAANAPIEGREPIAMRARARLLLEGEYQFLSGLHHEPFSYRAQGDRRFVYLAQAQNEWDDKLIVQPDIETSTDLQGRRVIVSVPVPCVYGNIRRVLKASGADVEKIRFDFWRGYNVRTARDATDELIAGAKAGARGGRLAGVVVDVPFDNYAVRNGMKVLSLPSMPVIHNATICSNMEWVRENEDATDAFLRSMVDAIHYFKNNPDSVCEVLEKHYAPVVGIEAEQDIRHLQEYWARVLNPKPYPHPLALWNVYSLDVYEDPDTNHIGAMELWDTHYLRAIDDTGYIDELYGGQLNTRAPAVDVMI
jgi:ABC-type nitrate/sulfonate/bicarbonate transport system substrate-binding protein